MPSLVVRTPRRAARARPSDCGSTPTSAAISSAPLVLRRILIIRSVPILPEPMIATFLAMPRAFPEKCEKLQRRRSGRRRRHVAERLHLGLERQADHEHVMGKFDHVDPEADALAGQFVVEPDPEHHV